MSEVVQGQPGNENVDYEAVIQDREKLLNLGELTTGQLKSVENSAIEKAQNALVTDESSDDYRRIADKEMAHRMALEDKDRIAGLETKLASLGEPKTAIDKIGDIFSGDSLSRDSYKKEVEGIKNGVSSERSLVTDVAINSTEMAMEEKGVDTSIDSRTQADNAAENDIAVEARHAALDAIEPGGNNKKYDRYDHKGNTILG